MLDSVAGLIDRLVQPRTHANSVVGENTGPCLPAAKQRDGQHGKGDKSKDKGEVDECKGEIDKGKGGFVGENSTPHLPAVKNCDKEQEKGEVDKGKGAAVREDMAHWYAKVINLDDEQGKGDVEEGKTTLDKGKHIVDDALPNVPAKPNTICKGVWFIAPDGIKRWVHSSGCKYAAQVFISCQLICILRVL